MSKVTIAGDANGTGVFTIAAPNGNTNRTLTLPDEAGTILTTATAGVPIGGPAFSAYQSTLQSTSSGTWTKVAFQTEEFDTNLNFDSTANYRFTPTVAGYYQVNGAVQFAAPLASVEVVSIYKNGTSYKRGMLGKASFYSFSVSALVYLNGSTDYVELYALQNSGVAVNTNVASDTTYFQASMVRSA